MDGEELFCDVKYSLLFFVGALAAYRSPSGILGLSAQVGFALMPVIQALLQRRRRRV